MKQLLTDNPTRVLSFIQALIALLIGFSIITLTPAQIGLVIALAASALELVRGKVVPVSKLNRGTTPSGYESRNKLTKDHEWK